MSELLASYAAPLLVRQDKDEATCGGCGGKTLAEAGFEQPLQHCGQPQLAGYVYHFANDLLRQLGLAPLCIPHGLKTETSDSATGVMDPVSAFGLAANILQFIDLTSKLFSAGYQLHQAGTSQLELDLGLVIRDLGDVTRGLNVSLRPPGVNVVLNADDQVCIESL